MARNKSTVYLGYDDEEINPNYGQLNSTVNKIGGKPDWPTASGEIKVPSCTFCSMTRPLILQLYAPLENSQFHRTLFIFSCLNPACSQNSKSWTCIRVQHLEAMDINGATSSGSKKKKHSKILDKPTTINWCSSADDWGLDEGIPKIDREVDEVEKHRPQNEENGNLVGNLECLKKGDEETDGEEDDSHSMENELICGFGNLDVHVCQQNLNEDPNANSASGVDIVDANTFGATSLSFAEIEDAETDVVLVETPEKPRRDLVALLQQTHVCGLVSLDKMKDVTLKSYYIAVDLEERHILDEHYIGSLSADHIREIYQEYKRQDEADFSPNGGYSIDVSNVESPESYEKSLPPHGDIIFHQFLTTIQRNPGQVIRYTRDSLPLLIAPLTEAVPKCPNCNEDTICEVQILPTLISKLCLYQNNEPAPIEFGNVLVFTCLKSCWDTPDKLRYELVVVQAEK